MLFLAVDSMVMSDVTRILDAIGRGDPHAAAELLPLVYDELRKLASQKLTHEKPGQTLQATALVHEAFLRLVRTPEPSCAEEAQREVADQLPLYPKPLPPNLGK